MKSTIIPDIQRHGAKKAISVATLIGALGKDTGYKQTHTVNNTAAFITIVFESL